MSHSDASASVPPTPPQAPVDGRRWGRLFLLVVGLYVLAHLLLRLLASPTVGVDDVEQVIFSQSLALGYGTLQPPLYTWLLHGLELVLGPGVLAAALLKYALLLLTYLGYYLSGRRLLNDPRLAVLAALSLSLLGPLAWGIHQGVTHSILLAAVCAWTLHAVLRIAATGRRRDYLWLGLLLSAGILAKFNYVLFALGLLAAALAEPALRSRLLQRRFMLTLIPAAAVTLPYLAWVLADAQGVAAGLERKLVAGSDRPYLAGLWQGLRGLGVALVEFLSPLWLVLALVLPGVYGRRHAPRGAEGLDAERLLAVFHLAALGLLLAGVLAGGITFLKGRWMHPVLMLAPLYAFVRLERRGYSLRRLRIHAWTLGVLAVLVMGALALQAWVAPRWGSTARIHEPWPELADRVARATGLEHGTVAAADEHIAGNFRVRFPRARVVTAHYPDYLPPPGTGEPGGCLLVWRGGKTAGAPAELLDYARDRLGVVLPAAGAISGTAVAALRHAPERTREIGWLWLPGGSGECR